MNFQTPGRSRLGSMAMGTCLVALLAGCAAEVEAPFDASEAGSGLRPDGTPDPTAVSSDPCLKPFGPWAPGECDVGDERGCPDKPASSECKQVCVNVEGRAVWGPESWDLCRYYDTEWRVDGGEQACACQQNQATVGTPLVLSFDGGAVHFDAEQEAAFDLTADGLCQPTDWPSEATPWLALDRDGDGRIGSGAELFGSAVRLRDGSLANNGFEALRELDTNRDGSFDAGDDAFSVVRVWSDRNRDRESQPEELRSLRESGVLRIRLDERDDRRCDARGNCEGERSAFSFVDGRGREREGTVIDVYLRLR